MSLKIHFLKPNYTLHAAMHLEEEEFARLGSVGAFIPHIVAAHGKLCRCGLQEFEVEAKLWMSPTKSLVNSRSSLRTLPAYEPKVTTTHILRFSPAVLYLHAREGNQETSASKRQRSRGSTPPRPSPQLSLVSKGNKMCQIVRSSESNSASTWETYGDFYATLTTVNGVLIDNSAPLGAICDQALVNRESHVCVLFASPSAFSAKRFSSTLAFGYDMSSTAQFARVAKHVDFLRQLGRSPSYAVLQLDFGRVVDDAMNGPSYTESKESVQAMLERFVRHQVMRLVREYSEAVPSLKDFPASCPRDTIILNLLKLLLKGHCPLIVCVHAFEAVLERVSLCSLWEPSGIHGAIRPVIQFVDDMLFAPLAASHKRKGIVFKIAITGTNPHVYLDWTKLAGLPYKDVSLSLAALPLHGFTWEQCLTGLRTFWQGLHTTGVAKDDLRTAWNMQHDKLWRLRPEDARTVDSKTVPIDPATLIQITNLLDNSRADRTLSTTRQPLTKGDFDTNVKLLKRYQACLPMLFPLVRDSPTLFRNLVRDVPRNYPLVKVTASAGLTWTYAQLGDADTPRRDVGLLQFPMLASLGLLKVQALKDCDDAWKFCVAGPHAMQTLKKVIAEVDAYTSRVLNLNAKISVNDFTLEWLQKVILEILNGGRMRAPKDEADFQRIVLDLLRDFLQFNGQWRHQAQPESWFRCGTKQKRWDGRGDIVMLLKIDNTWRVYIIELKYFLASATAEATQAHLQKHNRALPVATPEYFKAALEIVKFPAGWVARLAKLTLPGFDAKANVLTESDIRANYLDRETNTWAIKTATGMRESAPKQVQTYVDGAVQGVGEELGKDEPGIADVRYTKYEEAAADVILTVFIPIALVLISTVLLYGEEGTKRNAHFRPAMAGVYHWTQDPSNDDIESVRKAKHTSRGQ